MNSIESRMYHATLSGGGGNSTARLIGRVVVTVFIRFVADTLILVERL